ncbi:glycosyltransferase family 4 protein [Dethiobacter alkaliphilus]|uniref:Glycosyl transferase group 1 n=1 Tax=Dethiobacter alkaliphilus AHT 1 TaxID=555088 RepID=C0GES9_DETAL|nr:glycosyltransferase family 4 protein [Dethiobacter alkaliphilus]EEG78111.1 glycosyl transferase group 1 [Dethiobacter alkaliphilus AHT 1]
MKQQLRVAIITPGSHPIPDPNSTSVEEDVYKISTILQHDIDFTIFGRKIKKHPFHERIGELTFIRSPYINPRSYITEIIKELQNTETDIIQVENRPRYIKHLRESFPSRQLWLFLHSTLFINRNHISKEELLDCINSTDKIIVNSQYLKDYVVKYTCCQEEKVVVIHLGADTAQFKPKWDPGIKQQTEQFRKSLGIQNKKVVLYVGRLRKIKGVHHLLNAFPAVAKEVPDAVLFIVGSAFYGVNKQTKYVQELHHAAQCIKNSVHFIPHVPHNEIQKWFQIADILAVPSKAEPFGKVVVEAMATGIPVVGTNAGGIPEIIEHHKTGILLNHESIEKDLSNAVIDLLSNPTKAHTISQNAVRHVYENFTWEHSADRMLRLYQTISQP